MSSLEFTRSNTQPIRYLRYVLTLAIPLIFFLVTISYTRGPSFASSDEGGYLSWAKIIAGKSSPIGSPVYPGYGFLLAPLYLIFDSPQRIWIGVVFINFLLCIGSLLLAQKLHRQLDPMATESALLTSLVVISAYPMFGTMMGYAFTSIPSTFFLLLAIVLIEQVVNHQTTHTVGFIVVTGFLSILHPTHLAFVIFALWLLVHTRSTRKSAISYTSGLITLVVIGQRLLKPYLFSKVLGNESDVTLGYSFTSRFFGDLTDVPRYWYFIREIATLSYSLVISTLGLVGLVLFTFFREVRQNRIAEHRSANFYSLFGIVIPLIGYTLLTAQAFGFVPESTYFGKRIEEHVFLRYVEPALIPTLVAGVVSLPLLKKLQTRLHIVFMQVLVLVLGGITLNSAITTKIGLEGEIGKLDYLTFMANGFWPASIEVPPSTLFWSVIGIVSLVILASNRRRLLVLGLLAMNLLVMPAQIDHYLWFYSEYAEPSKVAEVARKIAAAGSCIAFDNTLAPDFEGRGAMYQWVEFGNYAFQFPNHHFDRMDRARWEEQCDGPLITFTPKFDTDAIAIRDSDKEAYLVLKSFKDVSSLTENYFELTTSRIPGDSCIRNGCFGYAAPKLLAGSEVGQIEKGGIATNDRSGILLQSLGDVLNEGNYVLSITGSFTSLSGVSVELLADNDATQVLNTSLLTRFTKQNALDIPFNLGYWVSDIRIVIRVSSESRIRVDGFRITSRD